MEKDCQKDIDIPSFTIVRVWAKPTYSKIMPLVSRLAKTLPAIVVLMLCYPSSAYADEQRYISIRNTDTVWTPGNICVYQFRLDNGGSGVGLAAVCFAGAERQGGQHVGDGNNGRSPFGDSDATRSQEAFLEHECVENVSAIEIMTATEERNGHQARLPLSVFDPQYYQPLSVSVAVNKAS